MNKKTLFFGLALIAALTYGIVYLTFLKNKPETTSTPAINTVNQTSQGNLAQTPSRNEKVYRNDKYNFEFTYPLYLSLGPVSDTVNQPQDSNIQPGLSFTLTNSKAGLPDVYFFLSKNPPKSWYPDFSDTCQPSESCLTTFGKTADGIKTQTVTYRESTYTVHAVSFFNEDIVVSIRATLNQAITFGEIFPNKEEVNPDVDKIASTLHFLK